MLSGAVAKIHTVEVYTFGSRVMVEIFMARPVHDCVLDHNPGLMQEIFAESTKTRSTLAGVFVTISPELHRRYIHTLNAVIITLNTKVKNYEFSGSV